MKRLAAVLATQSIILLALLAAAGSTPAVALTSGTWVTTGNMNVARMGHTATLLTNGQVLVAGGTNGHGALFASAELYDPGTGRWTATGSLSQARAHHTATLLPSGEVLVTGGDGAEATAEIYNPATGRWLAAGTMTQARTHHAAAALEDGSVLVAGGIGASGAELASAELFNPATGSWTAAGSMTYARAFAAATLLPNGEVLIAGGNEITSAAGHSAEAYRDGQWKPTSSMSSERSGDTATMLPNGEALVFGGGPLAAGEKYNPGTGTWANTDGFGASPPVQGQTETRLATGNVLVAGGVDRYHDTGDVAHLYDPSTDRWEPTGALNHARSQHTATVLANGLVLVTGGQLTLSSATGTSSTVLASSELYLP
jgi:N-acetylneuraminic acid mutarotase